MGIIFDLLTLPVLGPIRLVSTVAKVVAEEALRHAMDEGSVRGELMELQQRWDVGEIGEEEYNRQEQALLERLQAIRKLTEAQTG
jgi:uncharacterized membrane protein